MACTEDWGRSHMLQRLAKQLQFYKPPSVLDELEDDNDDGIGLSSGISCNSLAVRNEECFCANNLRERRAAVLICLFECPEGELRVILTRRSMKLASHPGDVALPGGKMEEEDADESATALREAMEEIGLNSGLVQVVAKLECFMSQHLVTVVPVIGLVAEIEHFKPVLNAEEVDAIFDVPLEMFLKEDNHRFEEREWMGWKYILHLFDFESEQGQFLIWGLTASILIRAASVIYQQPPFFQGHLPDFQKLQKAVHNVHNVNSNVP
ncbi:nudix hydrolase 15 mitochondrial [Prunus yedoensis var. nudiflora]|uniref:Nudix hydrolase 15 mitochondrial n=1 Tax=Prunus yedoensis var. nudiflora TaxID=2094558 RepID=A0A314Z1U7_PRUYE|nr:nudix hydrolase 15 mitochondrial [Prunus yedoensis var. nudiflora]